MYQCSKCSGNLKFNIESQMMQCDYCGERVDPYAVEEKSDALESVIQEDEFEVTVFTCPQCGGELLSYDDTAATFCSYCGGSTILTSRISKEKRPQHIIPFQKTKEQCKEAYAKMVKRCFFLPKEMRDEEYISKFRSIYMPYWVYSYEKNGPVVFKGIKRKVVDEHVYLELYKIETEIEAEYKGLTYDASSAFSDALSNAIAPFEWWGAKPFTPAYLSGFYADTADVSQDLYEEDARNIARTDMCTRLRQDPECQKFEISELLEEVILNNPAKIELAMLPVWFLSYRNKDRVSYAVVNGQTGEVAGDMPIDKKNFVKWSCLWAVPVAILLMLLMNVSPATFLWLTVGLAMICCIISCSQKRDIRAKENFQDDKGRWYPVTPGKVWHITFSLGDDTAFVLGAIVVMLAMYGVLVALAPLMSLYGAEMYIKKFIALGVYFLIPVIYMLIPRGSYTTKNKANLTWGDFLDTLRKTGLGILLSLFILWIQPQYAVFYYGSALFTMGLVVWDIMGILDRHNILVTREIPQFRKRGGESDGR